MKRILKQMNITNKVSVDFFQSEYVKQEKISIPYVNVAAGNIVKFGYIVEDRGIDYPILVDGKAMYCGRQTGILEASSGDDNEIICSTIAVPAAFKSQLNYIILV